MPRSQRSKRRSAADGDSGLRLHQVWLMLAGTAGEFSIELPKERLVLGVGIASAKFAVLRRARRSATIRALSRTSLLILHASDPHTLMEREPRIGAPVYEVVRQRPGREPVSPKGDILTEEIEDAEAEVDKALRPSGQG
jgi:hypothetical protein